MIVQLSAGNHLEVSWQWRWFRRTRVWSLWRATVADDLQANFECILYRLPQDEMHRELLAMAVPATDLALFVEAVNDPSRIPYSPQAPLAKVKRIRDEAKAKVRQAA